MLLFTNPYDCVLSMCVVYYYLQAHVSVVPMRVAQYYLQAHLVVCCRCVLRIASPLGFCVGLFSLHLFITSRLLGGVHIYRESSTWGASGKSCTAPILSRSVSICRCHCPCRHDGWASCVAVRCVGLHCVSLRSPCVALCSPPKHRAFFLYQ